MQEAGSEAAWRGRALRTFETLPRVEPGLGAGSAGGRGAGRAGSARRNAGTLATLPSRAAARRSRHWAPGRGGPGGGRGPGGGPRGAEKSAGPGARGRAAWVSVPRRRLRSLPGGCGSPGAAGVGAVGRSRATDPSHPRRSNGRAGGARRRGGAGSRRGPSTFPGPRATARRGKPGPRGEGFQETKALPWAVGVGGRLGGSLWRHVHPAGVGLCGLGFGTLICPCLCVSVLCAGVRRWVSWARRRVSLYVVCAVYVSGLGVRGVCARPEPAPPQLLAPCCRPGPRLGSNFSRGSPRSSPPLFSLLRSSGPRASGMGLGGGIGWSWAPARAGRSVPDPTGSRRDAAGPGLGLETAQTEEGTGQPASPAQLLGESV